MTAPESRPATRLLLVTGLSGAGKSVTLKVLEDLGYEAIDNLPLRLVHNLVRDAEDAAPALALGLGLRTRGFDADTHHADVFRDLNFGQASGIAQQLTSDFAEGKVDRVLLIYSQYHSVANQVPVVEQLLPIQSDSTDDSARAGNYLFEPEPDQLLEALVPRHVNFQVWSALLATNAGFFAAQMTAMDNATKNAGDLVDELTREMNKERQSSITLELMDIIGGAEAVA